jgi:uncharacterized protein YjbI with pentapeptide repeats
MEAREIICQGASAWNRWRDDHPSYAWGDYDFTHYFAPPKYRLPISRPDLSEISLRGKDLSSANFEGCILRGADLRGTSLAGADFSYADLTGADLRGASLIGSHGSNTTFHQAILLNADCRDTRFHNCDFEHACLNGADLRGARISDSLVYGIAAWGINSEKSEQGNLHITEFGLGDAGIINSPMYQLPVNTATVDSIDLAVLLHLLTNYSNPASILNLLSTRIVLVLGRFTEERKRFLDKIRDTLRGTRYCPVMFDFVKPGNRTFTETVSTLAHLARFIIADISDAKIVIQELHRIVPMNPSVPVQPICYAGSDINVIIEDLRFYPWFLDVVRYSDSQVSIGSFEELVISKVELFIKERQQSDLNSGN